jgi:phage repressor protein C with HTH and peptisase S24 domain
MSTAESRRDAIRAFMALRGFTATSWSREAGVPESTLRSFLSGKSSALRHDTLEKLATAAGVTVAEVIGERRSDTRELVAIKPLAVRTELDGHAVVEDAPSGQPLYWRSEWIERYLSGKSENGRCLKIEGETLIEGVYDGDVVCLDLSRTNPNRDPGIYCVFDGRDLFVRRLQALAGSGGALRMLSDNDLYPSYEIDARKVQIVRRVVWRSGAI